MTRILTVGRWTFDHVSYDAGADVAYLSIGPPRRAVGEKTPEGHICLYDEETGDFCGLTIIGLRRIIDGELPGGVTIPSPPHAEDLDRDELGDLVAA